MADEEKHECDHCYGSGIVCANCYMPMIDCDCGHWDPSECPECVDGYIEY